MANLLSRLFSGKKPPAVEKVIMLSGGASVLTPFSGDAYSNDIYRSAVDAIARNVAKLKGTHVVKTKSERFDGNGNLNRLLQVRPNSYISAYDMIYRMITHYYLYNNAFAYLQKDDNGNLIGIYPLRASNVEFMADNSEKLYIKFNFDNGKQYTFAYFDIIHLRRNYNSNDLFGDPNTALLTALEVAHTQNEGIVSAIKNGANIRGILKFNQVLSPEILKKEKERFIADYMQMDNNGGVVITDAKAEYTPLNQTPYVIDGNQLKATKDKIYSYLGISENIVNSSYNENEWAAFYESVIEPIAIQLSLEFTDKIFTQREQTFGNSILFEANRLQFASVETKIKLVGELMPLGVLTLNQALEVLNMPTIPDGDKRIVSLNYINADKADTYQLGGANERN